MILLFTVGKISNVLLKVNVTGLNLEPCQRKLRQRYDALEDRLLELGITNNQLCAHDPTATNDVCKVRYPPLIIMINWMIQNKEEIFYMKIM